MTERIIVLGISTFSEYLVRYLNARWDVDIIAVDKNEERINAVTEHVSRPIIGSATNDELLRHLDVASADHVVVSLGDIESSLVCVLYLKDLDAKRIVVKALNQEHEKILELLKVDEIVFPERSMAEILGFSLIYPHMQDERRFGNEESMVEVCVPPALVGKQIKDFDVIADNGARIVLAINVRAGSVVTAPGDDYVLGIGDSLFMIGGTRVLERLESLFEEANTA